MSNISEAEAFAPPQERNHSNDAWARLLARNVDYLLLVTPLTLVFGGLIGLIGAAVAPDEMNALLENKIASWAIGLAAAVGAAFVLETVLISAFGGTPGKALMGVKVAREEGGGKPSVATAAKRYFLVLALGRGLGLPLLSLIAVITSYNHYTTHGETVWDEMLELSVSRRNVALWRWALAILATIAIAASTFLALSGDALQHLLNNDAGQ